MKSWKNRRNTYWIFIATVFGLIFPSNQTNNYKNIIGLLLCWALYWFCFFYNNQEVEEQERREKEEHQKRIELELAKKERERIEKGKKAQQFYELIECPKIINYIIAKYNKDWEKDLYPRDARYHINDIKRRIKSDIEFEERKIRIHEDYIKKLENLKKKTKSLSKQNELNDKIEASQFIINRCHEHIKGIPKKYDDRISLYQDQIERYKNQCREYEQKANELLLNSPEEIIKAINCYLCKIKRIKYSSLKNGYNDKNTWVKNKEEKIPYLLQAKSDAINRIKQMKKIK